MNYSDGLPLDIPYAVQKARAMGMGDEKIAKALGLTQAELKKVARPAASQNIRPHKIVEIPTKKKR